MEKTIPVHPNDEQRLWRMLPGSDLQKVLHNEIVKRICASQRKLETVMQHELQDNQAEVRVLRQLLGMIHQHDSQSVKEIYGRQ